jgi:hypothetical protein
VDNVQNFNSYIRKNCLISERSLLLYPFTKRVIKLTLIIIVGYHCLSTLYKILSNILLSRLVPYINEIVGHHRWGFRRNRSTTDQISCIHQKLERKWEYNETVQQLFIDFKKAYDSMRREVLYNISYPEWSKTRRCSITTAFQLFFRICH